MGSRACGCGREGPSTRPPAAVTRAVLAVESASLNNEWIGTRVGAYDRTMKIAFVAEGLWPTFQRAAGYYRSGRSRPGRVNNHLLAVLDSHIAECNDYVLHQHHTH